MDKKNQYAGSQGANYVEPEEYNQGENKEYGIGASQENPGFLQVSPVSLSSFLKSWFAAEDYQRARNNRCQESHMLAFIIV